MAVTVYMLRNTCSWIWKFLKTYLRRKKIGFYVSGLRIPKDLSSWKQNSQLFLENTGSSALQSYMNSRLSCLTIFLTPSGAGKTFILSNISKDFESEH